MSCYVYLFTPPNLHPRHGPVPGLRPVIVRHWLTDPVSGWANLHLLFWLSIVPFVTGWMGENHFAPAPTAAYGIVLLMAAIAYVILQRVIIRSQGEGSLLKKAVKGDWKASPWRRRFRGWPDCSLHSWP